MMLDERKLLIQRDAKTIVSIIKMTDKNYRSILFYEISVALLDRGLPFLSYLFGKMVTDYGTEEDE
jgi:hypothetical protein